MNLNDNIAIRKMDEFEELYRKSPAAKILYEKSALFPNKSMSLYSSGRSGMSIAETSYPQQSISLLEFQKPTVLLKKLTPNTFHKYRRTPFLSPKAKFIQSIKDTLGNVEEFRAPTEVVKVLQRRDDRTYKSRDENNRMISHIESQETAANDRMINHVTSRKSEENDQIINHIDSKDNDQMISEKQHTNNSIILSSNWKSVHILHKEDRERHNTNGILTSLRQNDKNQCAESSGEVDEHSSIQNVYPSTDCLLDKSVAKNLISDIPDLHDRAEMSPDSVELNRKCKISTPMINLYKHPLEKSTNTNKHEQNSIKAGVKQQSDMLTPASSQCESDSNFENEGCIDGLVKTLFEFSESTAGEEHIATGYDRVSSRQLENRKDPIQVKDEKKKSEKDTPVSASIRKSKNVSEISTENSDKSTIVLTDWSLRAVGHSRGIYVEGHRPGDPDGEYWHSSAIVKRITSRQLETGSGSKYKITGTIDQEMSLEYGFSKSFVKKFQNGFPKNWKELMQAELDSKSAGSDECKTRVEYKTHGKSKTPVDDRSLTPVIEEPLDVTPPVSIRGGKRKSDRKPVSKVFSNSQLSLSLKDLPCSSRGRLIKPPLAYWTGQRLRNLSTDLVEIVPGTSNLIGVSDSPTSLALHEQIQVTNVLRDFRSMKRNSSKSKKTKVKKDKDSSDIETSSRGSDVGSSSATDCDAISKFQSRRLKKNNKKAKSKLDTGESSQTAEGEIHVAEGTKPAESEPPVEGILRQPGGKRTLHCVFEAPGGSLPINSNAAVRATCNDRTLKSKDHVILETPKCSSSSSRSTTINSYKADENNSMGVSSMTNLEYDEAGDSSSSETPRSRGRRKSNRGKSKVVNENKTIENQQANFSNSELSCQEADDEQSDLDQRKRTKRCLRKQALLANVSKKTEYSNLKCKTSDPVVVGVIERNYEDKNTGSQRKMNRKNTVENVKIQTAVNFNNDYSITNTITNCKPRRKNDKRLSIEDCKNNGVWQPKEINTLQKAMKTVAPSAARFWHTIAMMVETKTATECQDKYQAITEPPRVSSKTEAKKDKGPVMLTARLGTMKRKRQLRQLVEQYDEDYEDDLFDMLDNQTSKKPKIPIDFVTDEDDGMSLNSAKFQTPTVRPLTRIPMSTQKTPKLSLLSPGMFHSVDRKQMDPYIHRLQGNRGRGLRPAKMKETKRRQSNNALQQFLNSHGTNVFDVTALSDVDSDEEKDHYWSDEDFQ